MPILRFHPLQTSHSIDQFFTTSGSSNKLNDLLYDKASGSLFLGYDQAGSGLVQVGQFSVLPEPSTPLLLALAAASLLSSHRWRPSTIGRHFS